MDEFGMFFQYLVYRGDGIYTSSHLKALVRKENGKNIYKNVDLSIFINNVPNGQIWTPFCRSDRNDSKCFFYRCI
jgi:hypothetical protein